MKNGLHSLEAMLLYSTATTSRLGDRNLHFFTKIYYDKGNFFFKSGTSKCKVTTTYSSALHTYFVDSPEWNSYKSLTVFFLHKTPETFFSFVEPTSNEILLVEFVLQSFLSLIESIRVLYTILCFRKFYRDVLEFVLNYVHLQL